MTEGMLHALVFSDMDGTFLADDKSVPQINWMALDVLSEHGIGFVPCTGRAWLTLPKRLMQHPSVQLIVETNGASIIDVRTGDKVFSLPMHKASVLSLFERVEDAACTFDIFSEGKVLTNRRRFERIRGFGIDEGNLKWLSQSRHTLDMSTRAIIHRCSPIDKVAMFFPMSFDRSMVTRAVDRDRTLIWTVGHPQNLEITNAHATKGNALKWVCNRLGVAVSRTMSFGDSANDRDMLIESAVGIAMPNETLPLKDVSDQVASLDNNHGGVGDYILRSLQG